ncbi:MAG: hypothetical protein WBD31_25045 [Rubripirellula sp.]
MESRLSVPGYGGRYPNWCAVDQLQRRTLGIQTLTTNGRPVDRLGRVLFRNVEHAATFAAMLGDSRYARLTGLHGLRLYFNHPTPRRTRFLVAIDSLRACLGFTISHLIADSMLASPP